MFVRFPIILARPTSLRGSQSPGPWPQVKEECLAVENKTLGSLVSAVSGATTMEKYPAGPAVLCVCVPVSVLCARVSCPAGCPVCCPPHHAGTRAAQVPAGSLRLLPSVQAPQTGTVLHPLSVLPSYPHPVTILSSLSCLCAPIPLLSSPSFHLRAPTPVPVLPCCVSCSHPCPCPSPCH